MFTVTREWIFAHRTPKGGWTLRQMQLVGSDWPPKHGWIDRATGKPITDQDKAKFEAYAKGSQVDLVSLLLKDDPDYQESRP